MNLSLTVAAFSQIRPSKGVFDEVEASHRTATLKLPWKHHPQLAVPLQRFATALPARPNMSKAPPGHAAPRAFEGPGDRNHTIPEAVQPRRGGGSSASPRVWWGAATAEFKQVKQR